jgi:hypothetical protein
MACIALAGFTQTAPGCVWRYSFHSTRTGTPCNENYWPDEAMLPKAHLSEATEKQGIAAIQPTGNMRSMRFSGSADAALLGQHDTAG